MNDVFERRRMQQGRQAVSYFPPEPWLELRDGLGVYLILPHSLATHDIRRFQVAGTAGWHRDYLGELGLDRLLDALKHGHPVIGGLGNEVQEIRDFYMRWRHVWLMDRPPQLAERLRDDVAGGTLAVFYLRHEPHQGYVGRGDEGAFRLPPPTVGSVIGWNAEQKIVAMFRAIPGYLEGAAKAEFEMFLTPENLGVMAAFLGVLGTAQMVPGADAAIDTMIAGLAWWQFGWAGLVAGKDFIEAVIEAGRAKTQDEIMLAAKLAAAALVSLGITLLLRKITQRVHEVKWEKAESPPEPAPKPARGSADDMMNRYRDGYKGVSHPHDSELPDGQQQFATESQYDPDNPTADQEAATENLKDQGWEPYKVNQVLHSGSDFNPNPMEQGDPVYKLGNMDIDPGAPGSTPSPYLLDQNGYDDLVNRGFVDGKSGEILDRIGIKQTIAIPCYNLAQKIVRGTINKSTTAVISKINPAREIFTLDDGSGDPMSGQLFMSGGGSQATVDPDAIDW